MNTCYELLKYVYIVYTNQSFGIEKTLTMVLKISNKKYQQELDVGMANTINTYLKTKSYPQTSQILSTIKTY